ncbi:hypothetical protein HanRHA438_Chr01g0009001 [Helianthus annuus]|uniref:Uncharacterized protein n=1 Tax=Helianthus annuus TaxID=4232 RepID=A0A9K3JSP0_HELAN|nr:hypothetical protein HanXRQr2_Chr01g0008731 [Helianthus annuus]KAJ0610742.1 hypothetical protein HanHA300_Chr01g0007161 [Helianthus annuus]KAJ0621531.1 hypothetical protein HanIR_Chr01g0009651 [Helianthus annuus]KAJ0625994.1 hypothetical protein HanHA89_Chr01g0007881 [Helianthus annuus]KAJ0829292.1 hypothetical protein HanLR1_Chr00c0015g0690131 [Helianthus annuus]
MLVQQKVAKLEKTKAETEEKLKQVEVENVVLKNEVFAINERLLDVEAGKNALNEAIDELLVENYDLNDANTTISNANEILKKEIEDLKVKDENKSKQIEMLYTVIEDRLGINVHAAFDDIKIRRAEARRMEKEQKDAEEAAAALKDKGKGVVDDNEEILGSSRQQEQQQPDADVNAADVEVNVAEVEVNEENALVPPQFFVLVGELKNVSYNREDNARRIEVERRRLKAKEAKKAQVDEKVDEEIDDEDEEDDDIKYIDDFHGSDDDKDDDDDQEIMEVH